MNKIDKFKELIDNKKESAMADLRITFEKLLSHPPGDPLHDKLQKMYWKLSGEHEAYFDVSILLEVLSYEDK